MRSSLRANFRLFDLRGHATFRVHRVSLSSQGIRAAAVPMAATRHYSKPTATTTCLAFDLIAVEDGPRLGTMSMHGRDTIQTPHYFALSSRGAVPHISQDMMRDHTAITGIYSALEDCELSS